MILEIPDIAAFQELMQADPSRDAKRAGARMNQPSATGYAPVSGMEMYWESYGAGGTSLRR